LFSSDGYHNNFISSDGYPVTSCSRARKSCAWAEWGSLVPSRFSSVVLPIFGSSTDKFRELYPPRFMSQHQSSSKWLAPCCAPRSLLSGARNYNTNDDFLRCHQSENLRSDLTSRPIGSLG
jgi:hypothetical protein